MNQDSIEFNKYIKRGAYHWDNISANPLKRNAFVVGRYMNIITLLKNNLKDGLQGKKILDVGCGDGVLSYLIAKEGAALYSIDNSKLAIKYAIEKVRQIDCKINYLLAPGIFFKNADSVKENIIFLRASALTLPFKNCEFDAAVSSDVIEHIKEPDNYLNEIQRVVKKSGIIVLSTPIRITEKPLDKMHYVEWFPEEYKKYIGSFVNLSSSFYQSHPLFWFELYYFSLILKIIINLISFFVNPFQKASKRLHFNMLQYSVSKKL